MISTPVMTIVIQPPCLNFSKTVTTRIEMHITNPIP